MSRFSWPLFASLAAGRWQSGSSTSRESTCSAASSGCQDRLALERPRAFGRGFTGTRHTHSARSGSLMYLIFFQTSASHLASALATAAPLSEGSPGLGCPAASSGAAPSTASAEAPGEARGWPGWASPLLVPLHRPSFMVGWSSSAVLAAATRARSTSRAMICSRKEGCSSVSARRCPSGSVATASASKPANGMPHALHSFKSSALL
mmetsp:Transcript_7423/g.20579  ORF Transcript_7423/g.20579 Transcript_7423/m.20579 type:complete len:207 (-) Transcript_7423:1187-1807(-)